MQRRLAPATFPFGTLAVNLMGCFAIGLLAGLADSRQRLGAEVRLFALVGVLGGFTTFSALGLETFAMMRDAAYVRAAINEGTHVVGGLALVWLGHALAR